MCHQEISPASRRSMRKHQHGRCIGRLCVRTLRYVHNRIVENVAAFASTKPCRVSPTASSSSGKMERIHFQNDVGDKTTTSTIVPEDNYTLVESQMHLTMHSKVFCLLI